MSAADTAEFIAVNAIMLVPRFRNQAEIFRGEPGNERAKAAAIVYDACADALQLIIDKAKQLP